MTQPFAAIDPVVAATQVAGLAVLAGAVAAIVAVAYRWYARERVPSGLAALIGLTAVAVYLNTTAALGQVIVGGVGLLDFDAALANTVTFAVAAVATLAGRRVGDRAALEAGVVSGARELETEVGRLVRTVGRVISVTLPEDAEDIGDIEGYEPVDGDTKEAMAGKTLLFPRRLTVAELRDRLATRLEEDYGVGHVSVDLADDGSVEYLAVGSRAAGLGPTLAPGTAATVIRADPAFAATSGDIVQVWRTGGGSGPERVATAELRGAVGDLVTVALDEADARALDPEERYRLVTLPTDPRPDREFASLLRNADETMVAATVEAGSELVGRTLRDLEVTVVAVRPADGELEAIPPRDRPLTAGDAVYAIARPEALRRLEAAAATAASEAESS